MALFVGISGPGQLFVFLNFIGLCTLMVAESSVEDDRLQ